MPVPVLVAAAVALGGVFVLRRTRFGRHLYAIGGNPEAARLSGIDVKRDDAVRLHDRSACSPRSPACSPPRAPTASRPATQGNLLELDAVTAVVIGGTSLAGGRGTIIGTVLGTLVFGTLATA